MIVDARLRPPIDAFQDVFAAARTMSPHAFSGNPEQPVPASVTSGSLADCVAEMDAAGIDRAVVPARVRSAAAGPAHNAALADFARTHDRFVGLGRPDVTSADPTAELEDLARQGLRGLALEPGHWNPAIRGDDPSLFNVYDWCQASLLPVVLMAGGNAGPDITYSAPTVVDHIAREFPRLRLIVTHGGWPWVVPAISVAMNRPNVYLAPDTYLFDVPGCRDFVDAGNGPLRDKLIFASGYPFFPLGPAVEWARRHFRREVLPGILADNAVRAFGIGQ